MKMYIAIYFEIEGQHLHPPINLGLEGSYLKHSGQCCLLANWNRCAKSTTFDLLSPPKWWIFLHLYQWTNPTKQHDTFSNNIAYSPRKQTCLATFYLHSLSFVSPNLVMLVALGIWIKNFLDCSHKVLETFMWYVFSNIVILIACISSLIVCKHAQSTCAFFNRTQA